MKRESSTGTSKVRISSYTVHLDLVLKIADFGLIKEQKQVEQSTLMTVVGTMPLMSSEMLMGTEDGEVKADSKV
ncbi:MAG: hypothetical protein EZS28_037497 [Streblomastix strix]|uniref:Protein kinase domain-containing protein n=1 Tax=Streblomastix strix TaxID=222440 RepID=A0A5J4U8S6_9EUKA|nr:MAG: hypothetical protein EZS28_037497 [Streblomastix strix]